MARDYQPPSVSAELEELREEYINDEDEKPMKKVIWQETDVVKEFDRLNVHEDLWAIHELRDVTAVDRNGKIANLLFSARDGHTFLVQGQIVVDQEGAKQLRTFRKKGYTNLNGSYIQLVKPDNISMGYSPLTLWVSSVSGWLEIQPSAAYRVMYEDMMHIIGVYFCAVVHTEERATDGMLAPLAVSDDVKEILTKYLLSIGGAATIPEVLQACKQSSAFLREQLRKKVTNEYYVSGIKTWKWLDSGFYRWVIAGFPGNPSDDLPIDPLLAKAVPPVQKNQPFGNTFRPAVRRSPTPTKPTSPTPVSDAASESPVDPDPALAATAPAPVAKGPARGLPDDLSPTITYTLPNGTTLTVDRCLRTVPKGESMSWARVNTGHHGLYLSPEFPAGLTPNMTTVEKFVVVGCHAMASDRFAELSQASLTNAIYWDFQINEHGAARQLISYYAKETAKKFLELGLAAYGKNSKVYKELMAAQYDESGLKVKEVLAIHAITKGGKELKHRTKGPPRKTNDATAAAAAAVAVAAASTSTAAPTPLPAAPVPQTASSNLTARPRKRASSASSEPIRDPRTRGPDHPPPSVPRPLPETDSLGKKIPPRIKRAKGFEDFF